MSPDLTDEDLQGMTREDLMATNKALVRLARLPPQNPSRKDWLHAEIQRVLDALAALDGMAAPVEAAMEGCDEGAHKWGLHTDCCMRCGVGRAEAAQQHAIEKNRRFAQRYGQSRVAQALESVHDATVLGKDVAVVLSVNEARANQGLGPVDGGDVTIAQWVERFNDTSKPIA